MLQIAIHHRLQYLLALGTTNAGVHSISCIMLTFTTAKVAVVNVAPAAPCGAIAFLSLSDNSFRWASVKSSFLALQYSRESDWDASGDQVLEVRSTAAIAQARLQLRFQTHLSSEVVTHCTGDTVPVSFRQTSVGRSLCQLYLCHQTVPLSRLFHVCCYR